MNKLKDKKIIAVLSYMWLLSFIPFLTTNDKFVKFHSKQGIRLTIIYTPIILILLLLNKIINIFCKLLQNDKYCGIIY